MSTPDSIHTATALDMRGRRVAVYQNTGHVRIEIGESPNRVDVDLSLEAARVIVHALADASLEARLWQIEDSNRLLSEVFLPVTFNSNDDARIMQPHTTEAGI
jgi:hypothetical protein